MNEINTVTDAQKNRNLGLYLAETEAQLQLQKNLCCLKKYSQELYNKFHSYQPTEAFLFIDEHLNKNIKYKNKMLIKNHTELNTRINNFISSPKLKYFTIGDSDWRNTNSLHVFHLERLRKVYHDIHTTNSQTEKKPIPLMLILGIGLGEQITRFMDNFNIYNMYIYEPSSDVFYASLHTLDFEPIFKKLSQQGKSISFSIGISSEIAVDELISRIRSELGYSAIETYFFECYINEEVLNFYESYSKSVYNAYFWLGFAQDEIVGIIHTKNKLKKRSQYLNRAKGSSKFPAVIVGAGPSLDKDILTIKKIQNKCIIFSCSSALEVLHKHGILPDFHLEMERSKTVITRIELFQDKDYLKKIHFVGVNTIHPDILGNFASEHFILKEFDSSTEILKFLGCTGINRVSFTHPTCGNTASTLAVTLGFKTIYLFGLDFGMHSSSLHHSKDSIYYHPNPQWENPNIESELTLKGNFCDEVQSTKILARGKNTLEELLENNVDVRCYNTSDGAYISGTTPIHADELFKKLTSDIINKDKIVIKLLNGSFADVPYLEYEEKVNSYWPKLGIALEKIIQMILSDLNIDINTKNQALEVFANQNKNALLVFRSFPQISMLLSGSFFQLQNVTSLLLLNLPDGQNINLAAKKMHEVWKDYFEDILYLYNNKISTESDDFDFFQQIKKYPESSLQNQ